MSFDAEMTPQAESPETAAPRRRGGLLPILAAVAIFVVGLFLASQFIGVLYGLVFPASPPLPEGVTELERVNEAYGVDEWVYSSSQDACSVVRFYQDNGGSCQIAPNTCDAGVVESIPPAPGTNVAQCQGDVTFSIFAMRWHSNIATGYRDGDPTRFRLSREVFWTGESPSPDLNDDPLEPPSP
jgi:hypothetical protein